MALKDLFSFLRPKATVRHSSGTNRFEIKDNKLTITRNGGSQTFDLGAGMNDGLARQLAQIGLSASDLQNLARLSQPAASRSSTLLNLTNRNVQTFADSRQSLGDRLSASESRPSPRNKPRLNWRSSTHTSRLTITVNGRQHTCDTTSGISEELREQLARQMGISVSELATLLKLPEDSLQAGTAPDDCVEPKRDDAPRKKPG